MDKIEKALKKLTKKEGGVIKKILLQLKNNQLDNLDLKKLKDRDDIYRIRKGKIRIIIKTTNTAQKILAIERRSDKTYKKN